MIPKSILCSGCPLYSDPRIGKKVGFSRPEGTGANGVLIVGEALGASEEQDGLPFRPYAASGTILESCFRRLGLDREQFALWNIVACRPPNNKLEGEWYEQAAISHCSRYLSEVINRFRPKVIVCLGATSLKTLTGLVGRNRTIGHLRGFILPGEGPARGIPTVASFHPAFLARGAKNLTGVLMRDIRLAVEISSRIGAGERIEQNAGTYETYPSTARAAAYLEYLRAHPELPISYDTETDDLEREPDESELGFEGDPRFSNITQIQFSHEPRQAIIFPWTGEYIDVARKILALPNPKWHWNGWIYDEPRLAKYNCLVRGDNHDLMWAWHHLQPDIPRNLQFAASFYAPDMPPWKHTSASDIRTYGGADVDAVQRIGVQLFADLRGAGVDGGYQRQVFGLWPILRRMCERGLPIDTVAKERLREEVDRRRLETEAVIQTLVPTHLRRVHPSLGYRIPPPEVRALASEQGIKLTGKDRLNKLPDLFKHQVHDRTGLECREFEDPKLGPIDRFYRNLPFLPNSSEQLKEYIRAKGHPVPTKLKERDDDGNLKETTEKKEIEKLYKKTKDEMYRLVIEARELAKIYSTYIEGWRIGEDGRVHSTFTFATGSGQLSSRNPNIQNAPKIGDLANAFRKIIRARPGYTLVSLDWTAFHALTLGFLARDPDYMRLSRLDIHSYFAGHLLGLPGRDTWLRLHDNELAEVLSAIKKEHKTVRDKKAKPTILGYGFGLGAQKLYDMNLESFASKAEAQKIIDMLNGLFPRTAQFREDIKRQAHEQGFLQSPFGYVRRFWDVYGYQQVKESYEPRWNERLFKGRNGKIYKVVAGDEAEAAIAFLPANCAYGHAKEIVLGLEERGLLEKYGLINWVHDDLLFECPTNLVDSCIRDISEAMESRSNILIDVDTAPHGLSCGVEASIGENWAGFNDDPAKGELNLGGMQAVYKTPLEKLA